jgi:hypothetical protein
MSVGPDRQMLRVVFEYQGHDTRWVETLPFGSVMLAQCSMS